MEGNGFNQWLVVSSRAAPYPVILINRNGIVSIKEHKESDGWLGCVIAVSVDALHDVIEVTDSMTSIMEQLGMPVE
jgi:hypothetical protein